MVFTVIVGYIGILIGHKGNNNRMLKSIIYGFICYTVTSIFSLLIVFIFGLFNKDIMNLFTTNTILNINILKTIMYGVIIIYLIYIIIYYLIGLKLFNKGVDVD